MNKKLSIMPIIIFVVVFSMFIVSAASSSPQLGDSKVVNTFLVYSNHPTNSTITITQGDSFSLSLVAYSHKGPLADEKLTFNNWVNLEDHKNGIYTAENLGSYYRYTKDLVIDTGKYHNNLKPGIYKVTFYAENQNGEKDSSTLTLIIKAYSIPDTTKPVVKILFPGNGQTYSENVKNMVFTATDNNLYYCTYKLNNNAPVRIGNPINGTNIVQGISSIKGSNIWSVTCFDYSGNNATDTVTFNVKANNPTGQTPVVKISFPQNKSYSTNVTYALFNVTGNNNNYFCWDILNGISTKLSSCSNNTINGISNLNSKFGTNNLTVYAMDNAGNIGKDNVVYEVKKVNPSPISIKITYPTNGATYIKNVTNMTFTATNYKNINYCNYNLNGKSYWFPSPGVLNIISSISSIEGKNIWSVTCFDYSGNNATDTVTFNVKANNPFGQTPKVRISFPQNKTYSTNVTYALFRVAGNSENYDCWYTLNSVTSQSRSCENITREVITNLGTKNGSNNLTVYAMDNAGNIGKDNVVYTLNKSSNKNIKLNLTVLVPVEGASYVKYIIFKAVTNINATVVYSLDGKNNATMNENFLRNFFSNNLSLSKGNHQVTFCGTSKLNSSDVSCITRDFKIIISNNGNSSNEDCPGVNNLTTPDITNFYKGKAINDAKKRKASINLDSTTKSQTKRLNFWKKFINWIVSLFGFKRVY